MFKSNYVGCKVYSPYFKKDIIVTAYYTDRLWRFRFAGGLQEHWAETRFSYFVKKGLVGKGRA